MEQGRIIVYTGEGKGKTSAALGAIMRMLGKGGTVGLAQFLKGDMPSHERDALKRFGKQATVVTAGKNFFREEADRAMQTAYAEEGFFRAKELLRNGVDLLVLDEFNLALHYGLIKTEEAIMLLQRRAATHVIITGRNAPKAIMDMADTVSVIENVKHAYQKNMPAVEGVDW